MYAQFKISSLTLKFTDLLRASKFYPKFTKQPNFINIKKLKQEALARSIKSENDKMALRVNQA